MKVTYHVRDIEFQEVLGDTHNCAYLIHPLTGFPKVFVLKGESPIRLSPHALYSSHTTMISVSSFWKEGSSAFCEIFFFGRFSEVLM